MPRLELTAELPDSARRMSLALRWPTTVFLVLIALLSGARGASAHPLLEDTLNVTIHADRLELEVRSTLRPVVISVAATPRQGGYFSPNETAALVQAHATYLAQHLHVRVDDQLKAASELHAALAEQLAEPVQEHVDLERYHAHFSLIYPLQGAATRLSLEQDMLSDAPSDRSWRVTYVVSVRRAGDSELLASGLLTRERGFDLQLPARGAQVGALSAQRDFAGYFWAGVRHIMDGWDHLLFVCALVLATRRFAELVKVVLAFTVAHSLTLTLAVLRVVHLPAAVIEPLIALSIVAVSLDNLLRPAHGARKARLAVAFGFGLVHGLGFAGPLVDALQGAPSGTIALGIAGFSLGVELGHQLVVLPLFAIVTGLATTTHDRSFSITLRVGSLATAFGGAFFLTRALETFVLA